MKAFGLRDAIPMPRLIVFANCGHLPARRYPEFVCGVAKFFCTPRQTSRILGGRQVPAIAETRSAALGIASRRPTLMQRNVCVLVAPHSKLVLELERLTLNSVSRSSTTVRNHRAMAGGLEQMMTRGNHSFVNLPAIRRYMSCIRRRRPSAIQEHASQCHHNRSREMRNRSFFVARHCLPLPPGQSL